MRVILNNDGVKYIQVVPGAQIAKEKSPAATVYLAVLAVSVASLLLTLM